MFTGIVEKTATVVRAPAASGGRLVVTPQGEPWTDLVLGESIAVSGACLTLTAFETSTITFDVVAETARVSDLSALSVGRRVNLERSLQVGDRFGGHYVLGHVDCVGRVAAAAGASPEPHLVVSFSAAFASFLVPKGSIAINGVSLTLGAVEADRFTVYLIPFTLRETNLGDLAAGETVNLEFDYFGKWALKQLHRDAYPTASPPPSLGEALDRSGFLREDLWNE